MFGGIRNRFSDLSVNCVGQSMSIRDAAIADVIFVIPVNALSSGVPKGHDAQRPQTEISLVHAGYYSIRRN